MAYYSSMEIKKIDLVLPNDFFEIILSEKDKEKNKRLKELQAKYKTREITLLEVDEIKKNTISNENKYGFTIFANEEDTDVYDRSKPVFYCDEFNKMGMKTAECEIASIIKTDRGFEFTDFGMTDSNYGWVEEHYTQLIKKYKGSISFDCVTEEGDVERIIFENGIKIKIK